MVAFAIRIDEKECTNCGLCVKDCSSGCLQPGNQRPIPARPEWCTLCSHCVAICPQDAVEHGGLGGGHLRPIKRDKLDPESYREVVISRRSVRWYQPEPVSWQEVQELLEVARYSPTASNTMDVGYSVVLDRSLIRATGLGIFSLGARIKRFLDTLPGRLLRRLFRASATMQILERYGARIQHFQGVVDQGRDPICYDAPVLILIHGPQNGRFVRENCAIAGANLVNYAHAKGYGACYLGLVVLALDWDKKLRIRLGVPPGRRACLALVLGRPGHRYRNPVLRPPAEVNWVGPKESG